MKTIKFMNGDKIIVNPNEYFWEYHENFLSYIIKTYPSEDDIIYLFEDNLSVLSIIHSLKANMLILMNNTSLEVLLELAEKWCVEEWLIESIKNKIIDKNKKFDLENIIKNFKFKCSNCQKGYDIFNNKMDSCKTHQFAFSESHNKFTCCGGGREDFCIIGFHTPDTNSIINFNRLYENIYSKQN